jgi:hypothetical protein
MVSDRSALYFSPVCIAINLLGELHVLEAIHGLRIAVEPKDIQMERRIVGTNFMVSDRSALYFSS